MVNIEQEINHARIKKTIKKFTDFRIASDFVSKTERFLILKLRNLILSANEFRETSHRKTLYREDLKLSERFLEMGKERTLANSELRKIILKVIGDDKQIQKGVIEIVRGKLVDDLREIIRKTEKLAKHTGKTLMSKHLEVFFNE